jgi:site-specific recombinase XerD
MNDINLNRNNKEILEKLRLYLLTEKHLLENSIVSYIEDIYKYLEYMENNNIHSYKKITYKDINNYLKYLDDNNYSIYSIVRKISSIS